MKRRSFVTALGAAAISAVALGLGDTVAGPRARTRRRVRRRIRRRHRRRVAIRMIAGRPVWVVPIGLAAGWELVRENRVVIVKETRFVERGGARVEVAVVADSDGETEEVDLLREDTAENGKEEKGSALPDDDMTTPGVEVTGDDSKK